MSRADGVRVTYENGVYLPEHDLWLDPTGSRRRLAFVSHAHSDHIGRHEGVILTEGTRRVMRLRLSGEREEWVLPWLEEGALLSEFPFLPGVRLGVLPAGHVIGSAQLYLETAEGSLLYTGDFKTRQGLAAEALQWRQADTLIMETTFGLPKFRFPPLEEVLAAIVAFCRKELAGGRVPVLLCYSLGKAQETVCALAAAGLVPVLHQAAYRVSRIYSDLMPGFPSGYALYKEGRAFCSGEVLVAPPAVAKKLVRENVGRFRTAILTGWALDPGARYRYGADAGFPLSDHAGYDDLLAYVEKVRPRRVLTHHGYAAAFATDLRERGVEAWALNQENQLTLAF